MDLSDPRIWKDGTEIVLHNFHIIAPLIAATAAAAWWLRGALIGKTIDNLEQEVKLREIHIQILAAGG